MKKILLAIFFLLLVSVLGRMYFLAEKKMKKPDSDNIASSTPQLVEIKKITPEEIASWDSFVNNRVGTVFYYPKNLTEPLTEVVKFPSIVEEEPKFFDHLEFAVAGNLFNVKTYVKEGASSTLEKWITESGKSFSANIGDYELIPIATTTAYRLKGKTISYAMMDGNIYEAGAYKDNKLIEIKDDPLYEKWISSFEFFPMVECWKGGPGDPFLNKN